MPHHRSPWYRALFSSSTHDHDHKTHPSISPVSSSEPPLRPFVPRHAQRDALLLQPAKLNVARARSSFASSRASSASIAESSAFPTAQWSTPVAPIDGPSSSPAASFTSSSSATSAAACPPRRVKPTSSDNPYAYSGPLETGLPIAWPEKRAVRAPSLSGVGSDERRSSWRAGGHKRSKTPRWLLSRPGSRMSTLGNMEALSSPMERDEENLPGLDAELKVQSGENSDVETETDDTVPNSTPAHSVKSSVTSGTEGDEVEMVEFRRYIGKGKGREDGKDRKLVAESIE